MSTGVERDELEELKEENAELKKKIEKPPDFEPDIRKAAKEGKFISVQYFIEMEQRTLL